MLDEPSAPPRSATFTLERKGKPLFLLKSRAITAARYWLSHPGDRNDKHIAKLDRTVNDLKSGGGWMSELKWTAVL